MEALDSKRLWWIIDGSEATSVEKESLILNPKSDKLLISQSVVRAFLSPNVYATHREAVKDISCSSQHAKCFRRVDYYGTSHRYNVEKKSRSRSLVWKIRYLHTGTGAGGEKRMTAPSEDISSAMLAAKCSVSEESCGADVKAYLAGKFQDVKPRSNSKCVTCHRGGNAADRCWVTHPELKRKRLADFLCDRYVTICA
jgi:hypothetical protein